MKMITYQTFGRVDGKKFVDEIAKYQHEDILSNQIVYAVLEQCDGKFAIVKQELNDLSSEAEWPKAIVIDKDIVDENEAIKRCFEIFRLD